MAFFINLCKFTSLQSNHVIMGPKTKLSKSKLSNKCCLLNGIIIILLHEYYKLESFVLWYPSVVILVVEFHVRGIKIRQVFCQKVNISKVNFYIFWKGIIPRQQKVVLFLMNKLFCKKIFEKSYVLARNVHLIKNRTVWKMA